MITCSPLNIHIRLHVPPRLLIVSSPSFCIDREGAGVQLAEAAQHEAVSRKVLRTETRRRRPPLQFQLQLLGIGDTAVIMSP